MYQGTRMSKILKIGNHMKIHLSVLAVVTGVFLFGCQSHSPHSVSLPSPPADAESFLYKENTLNLGVAISGGGVRSASFAYGALKRLYELGILQEVNLISTVSGGGYTGYEMFVNELYGNESGGEFGSNTFSKELFNERLFHHYYTSNFVNYKQIWGSFLNEWPAALYRRRIIEKYGINEPDDLTNFGDLATRTLDRSLPYFIVNTTIRTPKPSQAASEIYEFTPLLAGNQERGFRTYEPYQSPELSTTIAISGAAFAPLLARKIPDPTRVSGEIIKLSDGGHSENLGAFSLIRRGVKTIVILDGEQDPEYEFEAYTKLRDRLSWYGATIVVNDIDAIIAKDADGKAERSRLSEGGRINNPVMKGEVFDGSGKPISTIYYLKMANSIVADSEYTPSDVNDGEEILDTVRGLLKQSSDRNGNWSSLKLKGHDIDHRKLFAFHLWNYPNNILPSLWKVQAINAMPFGFTKLKFPHYSTADQDYFNNQFLAFVALGYFSARDLGQALTKPDELTHDLVAEGS